MGKVYRVTQTKWSDITIIDKHLTGFISKKDAEIEFYKNIDEYRKSYFIPNGDEREEIKENYYKYNDGDIIFEIKEIETIERTIIFNKKTGINNNLKDSYIIYGTEYELFYTTFEINNKKNVSELLDYYKIKENDIQNLIHRFFHTNVGINGIYDTSIAFIYTDLINLLNDYDCLIS